MVTSRVSSCFFSSFFGSILSHGKGSLHSAHHFFEEIGSHTTFFYLLILQEGVKDCNVYHSLVFMQWQVLSMVVVTLVLSKIYKNLVKCGLRNGVVFYVESLFVLGENTEYFGQGGWWRGKLVLQHIPMFFLQDASREGMPKELLNRLQVWVCPCNSHHYGVTVSKPVL